MSGGAYDYAYSKVREFGERLTDGETQEGYKPEISSEALALRQRFAAICLLVAEAMKAVEWEDSGDSGPEDTKTAIEAVLKARS